MIIDTKFEREQTVFVKDNDGEVLECIVSDIIGHLYSWSTWWHIEYTLVNQKWEYSIKTFSERDIFLTKEEIK